MEKVDLGEFILMMCSFGYPLGSGGVYLYLDGVCFVESWDSEFPWCWFSLLYGSGLGWRCSGCFMFLSVGWEICPLLLKCLHLPVPCCCCLLGW